MIKATMQRRVLVNYRIEPAALASVLPQPFRPAVIEKVRVPSRAGPPVLS